TLRRTLAEIRTLGHVIAPGYVDEVSTGVAVPVRDETGAVIAALSVVLPRDAETQFALGELHRAARDTERALGYRR
ncbi:IclR family transcriptional regulator domain-containing protein, partial [Enterococcus faecalis]